MGLKSRLIAFYQRLVGGSDRRLLDHEEEDAVLAEIERISRETDSTILPVRKFRKKILPSVRHAMGYISGLIPQVPGPVDFDSHRWEDDPLLRAMFISREELNGVLKSSKALKDFFRRTNASQAFAILVAEPKEKKIFGTEKNGEIVHRDVAQKIVFFEDFKVFAPAVDLAQTRIQFQYRALESLFTQAFEKIIDLQLWKEELERHRELLEFKVQYSENEDLKTDMSHTEIDDNQTQESLKALGDITRKLEEIKTELDTPEERIEHLNAILLNPEQHLRLKTVSLKLSRLGIRLDPSSTEPANEFTVAEFELGKEPKQVLVWIRVEQSSALSV
jgi:FtsZ-binding cell division protein ZapB